MLSEDIGIVEHILKNEKGWNTNQRFKVGNKDLSCKALDMRSVLKTMPKGFLTNHCITG